MGSSDAGVAPTVQLRIVLSWGYHMRVITTHQLSRMDPANVGGVLKPGRLLDPPGESRLAARIRPCERDDLAGVAAVYEHVVRSGRRVPPPRLAEYFQRTFFDCPWADSEIPSLVYEEDGKVGGFLGSHVRRLRLDGRSIRVACGGQLVVDPEARNKAIGAFLFRTHLSGPQDATIADGANERVRGMWEILGGEASLLKSMTWTRVLRPVRFGGDYALERLKRQVFAPLLRPVWRAMDSVFGLVASRFRPATPQVSAEPLTPRTLLEHWPLVTQSLRCHPDYDEAFLGWLFHELAEVKSRGILVRSLVRDNRGKVIGWYVYYLQRGTSEVMQVAAKRGAAADVLDHLLHHAYINGSAAVRGRVEPQLLGPLSTRRCIFGWDGSALIQSKAPALLGMLLSSQCLLGRLDGDWWMGHHTEPFS
jgi:GNAT superfamily N-acetyltransferase